MSPSYSAIVIGSGQGGGPLAQALAQAGRKTALIESAHIGGTCVNEGCTPTKTMIASARVAYLAGRGKEYGIEFDKPFKVNMETVRRRKREIVDSFRGGSEARIKHTEGLDLYMGKARFVGKKKEVEVTTNDGGEKKVLAADNIFINTGGRPAHLHIPGAENIDVLNSTTAMELDQVPDHLIVIGGGPVGLEFAQMYRRFGSNVTIVQRNPKLLGNEDPDVASAMLDLMQEDGLEVLLRCTPKSVSKGPDNTIRLVVDTTKNDSTEEEETTVTATHLLLAAGREPNTDYLNPSAAGITTYGPGYIRVNEFLETNVPGIYALGDVKGGPATTHISYDDFRVLRNNILSSPSSTGAVRPSSIKDRVLPYTVFTDPQLGRIGLTETEARARSDLDVLVAKMPMSYVARALETDESRGLMKVVVNKRTGQILGAAILGIDGGEMMSMLQIAMMGGLEYTRLQEAMFAHPLLSEALNNLWGFLE